MPGRLSWISDPPEKRKLDRERWDLASCQVSFVFRSAVSETEKKSKMSQPIRDQDGHIWFPIGLKNTNLADDVDIFLPVQFRCIPLSGFRKTNRKCLSESKARTAILDFRSARKKITNLVEDVEILLHIKFRWITFKEEVENVKS